MTQRNEEIAQQLQDMYFENGAVVDKASWDKTNELISQIVQNNRTDWLRSEIEKLESEKVTQFKDCGRCNQCELVIECEERGRDRTWNQALNSIITRYKEELKVLESK